MVEKRETWNNCFTFKFQLVIFYYGRNNGADNRMLWMLSGSDANTAHVVILTLDTTE